MSDRMTNGSRVKTTQEWHGKEWNWAYPCLAEGKAAKCNLTTVTASQAPEQVLGKAKRKCRCFVTSTHLNQCMFPNLLMPLKGTVCFTCWVIHQGILSLVLPGLHASFPTLQRLLLCWGKCQILKSSLESNLKQSLNCRFSSQTENKLDNSSAWCSAFHLLHLVSFREEQFRDWIYLKRPETTAIK